MKKSSNFIYNQKGGLDADSENILSKILNIKGIHFKLNKNGKKLNRLTPLLNNRSFNKYKLVNTSNNLNIPNNTSNNFNNPTYTRSDHYNSNNSSNNQNNNHNNPNNTSFNHNNPNNTSNKLNNPAKYCLS
jgi:hypothetical protein